MQALKDNPCAGAELTTALFAFWPLAIFRIFGRFSACHCFLLPFFPLPFFPVL
jgi:hypothetical protein